MPWDSIDRPRDEDESEQRQNPRRSPNHMSGRRSIDLGRPRPGGGHMARMTIEQKDRARSLMDEYGAPDRSLIELTDEAYGLVWMRWGAKDGMGEIDADVPERNLFIKPDGTRLVWASEGEPGLMEHHREPQQYVAAVMDEPIPGVPSVRVYGPFATSADALAEIASNHVQERCPEMTTGYLLLHRPDEIAREVALAPKVE